MREHPTPSRSQSGLARGATRSLALLVCLGTLAGVLIWAKLRLVTDIPRSAYADPRENEQNAQDGQDAGGEGDGQRVNGDAVDDAPLPGADRP